MAEHYALTSKAAESKIPKQPEKKPDPKPDPKQDPKAGKEPIKPAQNGPTTPVNVVPQLPKKDVSPSPIQTPTQTTPRTNPPVQLPVNQQPDFTNFFGKTEPKVEPKA